MLLHRDTRAQYVVAIDALNTRPLHALRSYALPTMDSNIDNVMLPGLSERCAHTPPMLEQASSHEYAWSPCTHSEIVTVGDNVGDAYKSKSKVKVSNETSKEQSNNLTVGNGVGEVGDAVGDGVIAMAFQTSFIKLLPVGL